MTYFPIGRRELLLAGASTVLCGCAHASRTADVADPEPVRGQFHHPIVGNYAVVRSTRRPYVIWGPRMEIRGLQRSAAGTWMSGPRLLEFEPPEASFNTVNDGRSLLHVLGPRQVHAVRTNVAEEKAVWLPTPTGRLAADLYLPKGRSRGAVVMVHGSGPHERDGHLGLHRYMAYSFAAAGLASITWAKRGIGGSEGKWETQSLSDLGADVAAAARWLGTTLPIPRGAIGAWGTSQAGWVTAMAIARHQAKFRVVGLVSAAGTGLSVIEQDIEYLRSEMPRQGISAEGVEAVVAARHALFEFIKSGDAAAYDRTRERAAAMGLSDWLTPPSKEIDRQARDAWYSTMELDFDPRLVWGDYQGSLLAIYGADDTQTPAQLTAGRLRAAFGPTLPPRHTIRIISRATHELLVSEPDAKDPLSEARRFHADVFADMTEWIRANLSTSAGSA